MTMWMLLLLPVISWAAPQTEAFIIQINDRNMQIISPDKKREMFSVIIENRSLSDQVGKFVVNGTNLKFVSVKSGKSETVEIESKSEATVQFVPISPAFQDVPLIFGKKAYEIPPKK